MSNSSLISYTKISPNRNSPRNHAIDTITPHCVVGQLTVESLGNIFAKSSRQASSNYGIGKDGKIAMYCPEGDRSWCSSSRDNDNRAVTIECASDLTSPYALNDIVYKSLIKLCTDICKRNGKKKLLFLGSKAETTIYYSKIKSDEMVLTAHRWFANTSCPGDWMYSRFANIAKEVTAALGGSTPASTPTATIKVGDLVQIKSGVKYATVNKVIPSWVLSEKWYVDKVNGDKALLGKNEKGSNNLTSWVYTKDLTVVKATTSTVSVSKPAAAPTTTAKPTTYSKTNFIKEVQKILGVAVDGIAGPKTLAATVTVSKSKNRTHAVVKPIQKYLYSLGYTSIGSADGVAGDKFDSAVKAYQKANKCVADGEITAKNTTWKKLLGLA